MISPHYMPLIGYAEAWSPPTAGILTGTPQYVGDGTAEEIDRLGARLRGAIVLTHRPQVQFLRTDRMEPSAGDGPVQTGNPPLPGPSSATPAPQMLTLLQTHGAGVALRPGAMEHGTVRVQGNRGTADDAVPSVVVAAEQYNMLVRLVQAGFYMQENQAAKAIFDAWLEPLRHLGVRRNVIEGIGSTDHVPFDQAGIPAFTAIKDFRNYDVRTRHTNADLADAVNVGDLQQSAVVLAAIAWHAAVRDEPIPRRQR